VFAAGDAVTGPDTVVGALGGGLRAAESIAHYLKNGDLNGFHSSFPKYTDDDIAKANIEGVKVVPRTKMPELDPQTRKSNFREVEQGFSEEQALAEAARCLDCGPCSECGLCATACQADAIDYTQKDVILDVNVGSVILTPGFTTLDASVKPEYGWSRFPNVVDSMEFERILAASGPTEGHVVRPSDHTEPKKVAFINCVGSRDRTLDMNYCSSVCCMYTTKESIIAKEHAPGLDITIFFIDMRAYGKGFDEYYQRAKRDYNIHYKRSRISKIDQDPETDDLILYGTTDEGEVIRERFQMVVLATAIKPKDSLPPLAEKLGIDLNQWGFIKTRPFERLQTTRDGIYACGAGVAPMDIPDSVSMASGAAMEASGHVYQDRGKLITPPEKVEPRPVYERPRIGVFICNCGSNIGGYVNCDWVAREVSKLPNVEYAEAVLYSCSEDNQVLMKEMVIEHDLDRFVVASCTPRTHEPLFRETLSQVGINPYMFELANIREQVSWVHQHDKERATAKALELVTATISKCRNFRPLDTPMLKVNQSALVIGGGVSGMTAALALANQDKSVTLVEREDELGGLMRKKHFSPDGNDPREYLKGLVDRVNSNPNLTVMTGSEISNIKGYVGNFTTELNTANGPKTVEHGVVIVATGTRELRGDHYNLGKDPRVLTQLDLEEKIAAGKIGDDVKNVVMIQCVGSRNLERPYCSRVCCTSAVTNALQLKRSRPEINVYVLYRDIRTYGLKERYYEDAREEGVIFIRFDDDNEPVLEGTEGRMDLRVKDEVLQREIIFHPDLLVLSTANLPLEDNEVLGQALKVPLDANGFFLEAHMKLRPVDFATDGVFVAGGAVSPKLVDECISQGNAAAARAMTVLSKEELLGQAIVSEVDESLCSGCMDCINTCPFGAIDLVEGKAKVNRILCKGCGACVATCRAGAIQQNEFSDEQLFSVVRSLLTGVTQ